MKEKELIVKPVVKRIFSLMLGELTKRSQCRLNELCQLKSLSNFNSVFGTKRIIFVLNIEEQTFTNAAIVADETS